MQSIIPGGAWEELDLALGSKYSLFAGYGGLENKDYRNSSWYQ